MHVLVHHCSLNVVLSIKANTQIFSKLVFPSTQQLVNILLLSIQLICLIQHLFQQFFSCHLPSPLEGYNLCLLLRFLSSLAIFAGKILTFTFLQEQRCHITLMTFSSEEIYQAHGLRTYKYSQRSSQKIWAIATHIMQALPPLFNS